MQTDNGVGNDNLEVAIQNMNIGQNPHEPGRGPQNDVIIDIVEEVNQGLNENNNQQNQQGNHEQQPIGINRADVLNPPNHEPIPVNNNQIVPGGGADAAVRNEQPQHQAIYAGNDRGHIQNNLRHRNAPAAMGGRNEILGWNHNHRQDLVFNQHPEQRVDDYHGVPMNLAYHNRAPIALQNQDVAQVNIQGQFHQVNPNVVQGARNNQIRDYPGNLRDETVQDLHFAGNRNLHDLQQGYQARNNNDNFQQPAQHQNNNQNNALQVPPGPLVDRSVNRQAGANRYYSNRQTNRYTPYMDMRRMKQNAKKMALMVWSMAEAAMYVPNRNNNNLQTNPNDRDDDDSSQHAS